MHEGTLYMRGWVPNWGDVASARKALPCSRDGFWQALATHEFCIPQHERASRDCLAGGVSYNSAHLYCAAQVLWYNPFEGASCTFVVLGAVLHVQPSVKTSEPLPTLNWWGYWGSLAISQSTRPQMAHPHPPLPEKINLAPSEFGGRHGVFDGIKGRCKPFKRSFGSALGAVRVRKSQWEGHPTPKIAQQLPSSVEYFEGDKR